MLCNIIHRYAFDPVTLVKFANLLKDIDSFFIHPAKLIKKETPETFYKIIVYRNSRKLYAVESFSMRKINIFAPIS